MTLRQGPQKLASDHGMFPTRIFPFFMTSAFYNFPLPPEVWVGWPYLKNESTLFQKWSGQSELVGRKWQDIFIYCDIFHIWYILTRPEWVGWPSLRSGRTFAEAPAPLHLNIHRHLFDKVFFIFIFVFISYHQELRNAKWNNRLVWNECAHVDCDGIALCLIVMDEGTARRVACKRSLHGKSVARTLLALMNISHRLHF